MNVFTLDIKPLLLQPGIEDPEVGLSIASSRGSPLPATVVDTWVVIYQALSKVTFPPTPIDVQILGQKRRYDHSSPIVHIARVVQFTHTGIDNGETRPTLTPRCITLLVSRPRQIVVAGLKSVSEYFWKMKSNLSEEVPPVELAQQRMI